jgi:hypothetical protein
MTNLSHKYSHTHTHTHTQTYTRSQSHTHTHKHLHTLSLSHTHTHTHTPVLCTLSARVFLELAHISQTHTTLDHLFNTHLHSYWAHLPAAASIWFPLRARQRVSILVLSQHATACEQQHQHRHRHHWQHRAPAFLYACCVLCVCMHIVTLIDFIITLAPSISLQNQKVVEHLA